MSHDVLARLAAYAPTPTSVADEWGPQQRESVLAVLVAGDTGAGAAAPRRLHFVPRPGALRSRAVAPIAASVAVLALAGGVAVVAGRNSGGHGAGPAGGGGSGAVSATGVPGSDTYRATVQTPRLGAHQWAYRAVTGYQVSPNSNDAPQLSASWLATNGSGRRFDATASAAERCSTDRPVQHPSFGNPTRSFVDALPDEPGALATYLRRHVDGSTSQEEAVFTAVGDVLREGDLLATSAQRAAMVTVLAGLQRTSVHTDVDERGRRAVRVDFVDPGQRGGEIQSLYFDPRSFQLLEERASTAGAAPADDAPSAPYSSEPSAKATTSQGLPTKASVSVMTAERIVDTLPANCGQK